MTREQAREFLIDISYKLGNMSVEYLSEKDGEKMRDAIKVLEQEPKIGYWIPTYGNVKCSVCGNVKDSREVGKATHYCDFCGAKMESGEEE